MATTNAKTATQETPAEVVKAPDAHALAVQEAATYSAGIAAARMAGKDIKNLALDVLAVSFGESADSFGRPTQTAADALFGAIGARNLDVMRRIDLAKKAISAQKAKWLAPTSEGGYGKTGADKFRPCAVQTAKGNDTQGKVTYRFLTPAQFDIAVGS